MPFSLSFFKSLTEDELGMLQYIVNDHNPKFDLDMLCAAKHHIICKLVINSKNKLKKDNPEAQSVYSSLCSKLGIQQN